MNTWRLALLLAGLTLPAAGFGKPIEKKDGIVTIPSDNSVDETVEKLKSILQSNGITLFVVIDHSGEAAKVGLKMPNTKVVIFGNPKGVRPSCLQLPALRSTCR
jgi:hypothetical protein